MVDELQVWYALGLNLLYKFSWVGVYWIKGVEIVSNRNNEKTTPSIVKIMKKY